MATLFPLVLKPLNNGTITTVDIDNGSAAYLSFGVSAGATGGARITSRGGVVPNAFSLSIVRSK